MAAQTSSASKTATRKQSAASRTKPPAKKAAARVSKGGTPSTKNPTPAKTKKVAQASEKPATKKPASKSVKKATKAATKSATNSVLSEPTKVTPKKSAPKTKAPVRPVKLSDDQKQLRAKLTGRLRELEGEYQRAMADLQELQSERTGEGAGEDQADAGTQSFEREQELALANGILDRMNQVEHAVGRIDTGTYGQCEQCGNPIPKARLEAFPAATLCVICKQKQERR